MVCWRRSRPWWRHARRARTVMRQNLVLALGYNALMVPLAVAGFVTPWLAVARGAVWLTRVTQWPWENLRFRFP